MVSSGWARPINYKPTSCQAIYFYFYIAYGILYDITAGGAYGLEGLNMVPSYNSWQVISDNKPDGGMKLRAPPA